MCATILPTIAVHGAGISLLDSGTERRPELDHKGPTDRPTTLIRHTAACLGVVQRVAVAGVSFEGVEDIGRSQSDGSDCDVI